MLRFAIRRLLWTIPILWVVITIVFFMMRSIGGDPFRHGPLLGLSNAGWVKYGDPQPPSIMRNQREQYGLDLPWYEQYGNYLKGVATLDLGPSLSFRSMRVTDIIKEMAPRSFELVLLAFVWAGAIGIPIGIVAALRPGSAFDHGVRVFTGLGVSLPSFLVATLLIYYVSQRVGALPTSGWTDGWRSRVLPTFTLSLVPMAYFARLLRGSLIETLETDYVQHARAKGLSSARVIGVHGLRNSVLPLITVAGPMFGTMVTGSFIVETIFSIPGISRYFVAAVVARDYTVVMGVTIVLAAFIVFMNLLVDLAQHALDPRLRSA
jgi:ABC-type dipeptide/oligopeptide/nickel transport system permease component